MQIERRPLTDVTPPTWNARTGHNVVGIADSIRTHGMLDPVGIWATQNDEPLEPPFLIVEGSGRFYAMRDELGEDDIPTIPHDFADEMAAQAYAINHNHQTDESSFDDARLEATLAGLEARERLHESGVDGSALAELRARLDEERQENEKGELKGDPDDVPDVQEDAITQRGDVWLCGEHRVMCGDATDARTTTATLRGRAAVLITDPPYNLGIDYEASGDSMCEEAYEDFAQREQGQAARSSAPRSRDAPPSARRRGPHPSQAREPDEGGQGRGMLLSDAGGVVV